MLQNLTIRNFTVFANASLDFGRHLNVIVGENGAGKSHLLKLPYSLLQTSYEEGRKPTNADAAPSKAALQSRLAEKLVGVFRPEQLGRLARRKQGRERCDMHLSCEDAQLDIAASFATNSRTEVSISKLPSAWLDIAPAYMPTRELLSIYPGFISLYDSHYLQFEETWRDTCLLLGQPLQKGPKEQRIRNLLEPLETAMGGVIELDSNGRFYLRNAQGRMEIPLVAEGLRKLGMLARLVATGALLEKAYLFWDEPEANLNPRLIRQVAGTIAALCKAGIQIFFATHSLFLLREIEMLLEHGCFSKLDTRFFGLHLEDGGVSVQQGRSVEDIGDIAALDEDLAQSERFLDPELRI